MIAIFSVIFITLALGFYSLGVWAERFAGFLKKWHLYAFWTGFAFDVSGTWLMHLMSDDPFNFLDIHTLTGQIALWLMFVHALWANWVIIKKNDIMRSKFHKFSLAVWLFWLIPYFGGMIMAMTK